MDVTNKQSFCTWLKVISALSLVLVFNWVNGQEGRKLPVEIAPVSQYIHDYDTLVCIKLIFNNDNISLKQESNHTLYDIRPNRSLKTNLGFSYRFLFFSLGFKPAFLPGNNDIQRKGKTNSLFFRLAIHNQHLVQELSIGFDKGFYLKNTGDFVSGWNSSKDSYLQIPNLTYAEVSGLTSYKLNRNFSLKSMSSGSEVQLKSCGSFVPALSYSYFVVDNADATSNLSSSQMSGNLAVIASVAYYYTHVIGSGWSISAGIAPGIGLNYTALTTRMAAGNFHNQYSDLMVSAFEKCAIGYNAPQFFAGAEIDLTQSWRTVNNTSVTIRNSKSYFQLYAGFRFSAPSFLRKATDHLKRLAPDRFQKMLK